MEAVLDNYDLFEQWDSRQAQWLERRPRCTCCGEHIQEESVVKMNGDYYCDKCLDDMRVYIDD